MGLAPDQEKPVCVHAYCGWDHRGLLQTTDRDKKGTDLAQFILISTGLLVEHSSYF